MKTTINVTKQNIKDLKTSEYKFYLKGCPRPMNKSRVLEGLNLGALIIAVKMSDDEKLDKLFVAMDKAFRG